MSSSVAFDGLFQFARGQSRIAFISRIKKSFWVRTHSHLRVSKINDPSKRQILMMPTRWAFVFFSSIVWLSPCYCSALFLQPPKAYNLGGSISSRIGNKLRHPPHHALPSLLLEDHTTSLTVQLVAAGTLGVVTGPLVESFLDIDPKSRDNSWRDTLLHGMMDSISNAARVYGIILILSIILAYTGTGMVEPSSSAMLYGSAPKISFIIWGALSVSTIKRSIFYQRISGDKLGRVRLLDQLLDFILCIMAGIIVVDELNVSNFMTTILDSIFAASGIGALAISLASKDLLEQIIGGLLVQAWDGFQVGDDVLLGDGTEGTIQKVGLVETEVCGYDNIVVKIPNRQIATQRVSNISRTKCSRVKQVLRFQYADIGVIPQVLQDIKSEIRSSIEEETLIDDGSKPFFAMLSDYRADHVEAVVLCHFTIQPFTQQYRIAKEQVLLAIARAALKHNVNFALPTISYHNTIPQNANSES